MNVQAKPGMLRVVLDAKCDMDDVEATALAIARFRSVKHVEPLIGLDASLEELDLSTRPRNALVRAKILTLRDLTALSHFELRRIKNLGKQGLDEIEERLKTLGLRLRPQTSGEFTAAVVAARQRNRERRAKFVEDFEVTRRALRNLWMLAASKSYAAGDWTDWRRVDEKLRQYAQQAAEKVGIELGYGDIDSFDREPLIVPKVNA